MEWSRRWGSNPRPARYECAALPTELHQHFGGAGSLRLSQVNHVCTEAASAEES